MNKCAARVCFTNIQRACQFLEATLQSLFPAAALALALLVSPAQAQVSQLSELGTICGGDMQQNGYGGCTAGEIAIAAVVDVQFQGNPTNCVLG